MKNRSSLLALTGLLSFAASAADAKPALTATAPAAAVAAAPDTRFADEKQKRSHAIGVMIASDMKKNFQRGGYEVDTETAAKSFSDALNGRPTTLTEAEAQVIVRSYTTELRQKAEEKRKADAEVNKKAGEAFLAANKSKEGVVTLPSGLQYKVIKQGDGPKPVATDSVTTHYKGTLIDGTEFDSSYSRGEPATFGVKGVIKGWTEALQLMPVGSKWQLYIPSELAYMERGSGQKIGPNAALIFDIELLSIKSSEPAAKPAAVGGSTQPVVTSDIIKVPSADELKKGAKIEVIKPADLERLQKEEAAKKSTPPVPPAPKK
jgi:FKBP-type peptidyl-prolyl cis-trans isomerase FklB